MGMTVAYGIPVISKYHEIDLIFVRQFFFYKALKVPLSMEKYSVYRFHSANENKYNDKEPKKTHRFNVMHMQWLTLKIIAFFPKLLIHSVEQLTLKPN